MISPRARETLDLVTIFVILTTCAVLVWAGWTSTVTHHPPPPPAPPLPTQALSTDGAATKGSRSAPVGMIEFSDFQCPYCGAFERSTMPQLDSEYVASGKVLLVFRHHPLDKLHPLAAGAAYAAVCADQQGRFWDMEHALFRDQKGLARTALFAKASAVGLNSSAFATCFDSGDAARIVRGDSEQAAALGLSGTPAFLIGTLGPDGRVSVSAVISGARPLRDFTTVIDGLLDQHHYRAWLWGGAAALALMTGALFLRRARQSGDHGFVDEKEKLAV